MDPAGSTFVFCDSLLLVKAGGLEPAGAAALAELAAARAVLDDFTVRPQGCRAVGLAGAADAAPAGCEWVRMRALVGAESPHAAAAGFQASAASWTCTRPASTHAVRSAFMLAPASGVIS